MRRKPSELFHLDIECLNSVGDLAWRHTENAGGFGLYPTGLLECGDDTFFFREVRVVNIDFRTRA